MLNSLVIWVMEEEIKGIYFSYWTIKRHQEKNAQEYKILHLDCESMHVVPTGGISFYT